MGDIVYLDEIRGDTIIGACRALRRMKEENPDSPEIDATVRRCKELLSLALGCLESIELGPVSDQPKRRRMNPKKR